MSKNMPKLPTTILLVTFTFLITLGLAISLQGVLGINVGNVLNLGGNLITDLQNPRPLFLQDAATKGYVDSAVGGFSWDSNCVQVSQTSGAACNTAVFCPGGYKVTGGGCSLGFGAQDPSSSPSGGSTAWVCSASGGGCTVTAICCKQ